jgi:hypothetical protein
MSAAAGDLVLSGISACCHKRIGFIERLPAEVELHCLQHQLTDSYIISPLYSAGALLYQTGAAPVFYPAFERKNHGH